MNYRLLGCSGLRVSEFCLGAATFGEEWGWGSPKAEARKIYDAYRDAGGNFIDTSNRYTLGTSEKFLGEFLQGHRDQMVIGTKYGLAPAGTDPNAGGNHRKNMMKSVEGSLKRLQTDYIDLYWLHIWDQITPVEEVMRAFDDLVRQGKILHAGVSNAPAWWVAQANTIASLRGWSPFIGTQLEYSLIERTVERELIPMAKAMNLGVVVWGSLAGGRLTGKYDTPQKPGEARYTTLKMPSADPERLRRIVDTLMRIAADTGRSAAQVALAWLRYRDIPVITVIGARKLSQFEDNMASLSLDLTPEQVKTLDEASRIEMGFPYEFLDRELNRRLVFGGLKDRILV